MGSGEGWLGGWQVEISLLELKNNKVLFRVFFNWLHIQHIQDFQELTHRISRIFGTRFPRSLNF